MTQRETGFSTKEPPISTLNIELGEKGENGNTKVDFLVLHKVLSRIVVTLYLPQNAKAENIFETTQYYKRCFNTTKSLFND